MKNNCKTFRKMLPINHNTEYPFSKICYKFETQIPSNILTTIFLLFHILNKEKMERVEYVCIFEYGNVSHTI